MPTAPLVETTEQPGAPYHWSRQEYENLIAPLSEPTPLIAVTALLPRPRHCTGAD